MCDFCKLDKFGDGKEITKQIKAEPIAMGMYEDVLRLEAWVMNDEEGINPKLQICLSVTNTSSDISTMDIPIKYCPICGRKL